MNNINQADEFFRLWVDTCNQREAILLRDWSKCPVFTAHVLTDFNSIIETIAESLNLKVYCGYYSIDAILFKDEDYVPDRPERTTWVRRIRIAFEHENYFDSGLFQEVSHLLITDCDLRVVVSYPENDKERRDELDYQHRIISGSDRAGQIADSNSFLFIIGERIENISKIKWTGFIYELGRWRDI